MKIKNIIFFVILLQSNTFSSFYSDLIEGFLIGFTIQNLTFTKLSNFLELEKKLKLPQLKLDTHKSSLFDLLSQAETKYFLISFFIGAIIGYRIDQRQADAQKRKKLEAEIERITNLPKNDRSYDEIDRYFVSANNQEKRHIHHGLMHSYIIMNSLIKNGPAIVIVPHAKTEKLGEFEKSMDPLKVINMLEKKENKEKIANFLQGGTLFTVDLLSTFFPCLKTNEHLYLISNTNEYSNNNRNRALLPA